MDTRLINEADFILYAAPILSFFQNYIDESDVNNILGPLGGDEVLGVPKTLEIERTLYQLRDHWDDGILVKFILDLVYNIVDEWTEKHPSEKFEELPRMEKSRYC